MRRHIAYIVHTFQMGGLERCIADLVNHLDRGRFQPHIFCLDRCGDAADWIKAADVPVEELHKHAGNDLRAVHQLGKLCQRHSIDLVHSHNWCTLVETMAARKWAGVPRHVHAQHGMDVGYLHLDGWHGRLQREAMRWSLRFLEATVTITEPVCRFLRDEFQVPPGRLHLIPNGIALPTPQELQSGRTTIRQQLAIPDSATLLGSVGRLAPVKGFDLAIDALALLRAKGHDVHLLLVGEGPEREPLEGHAAAQGLTNRVHLVGGQKNVPAWLGAMDVFINTSHSEGMSIAILEGMASGLPLAVADVGGNAALVNGPGACGLVVRPRTAPAYAQALEQLLTNPDLRHELADRGQRRARRYDVQHMVHDYEQLYERLFRA